MVEIRSLDDELYKAIYGLPRIGNYKEIWSKIKNNSEVLRNAVKVKRDKFDQRDILKGLCIADAMLINYEDVDEEAYNELIKTIYTNQDIARLVLDGASNGGYSFLLMSLFNPNLKLTEEQKSFAVDEAMNMCGTTRYKKISDEFYKSLDDAGVTDEITTTINIDGCVNPIGAKTKAIYMNQSIRMLDHTQAHGVGEFDIRYHILRNSNWSLEEKQKLIMDFWYNDETYGECLEQWEWDIVNDPANYSDGPMPWLEREYLYEYSYELLLKFYGDKKTTDRIWKKIEFCKQMRKLRPPQQELEITDKKKILVQLNSDN